MKNKTNWIASALALVLLSSCEVDTAEKSYVVIPVVDAIGVESKKLDDKDITFVNPTIIPLELTDKSMLGDVTIIGDEDGKLVVNDGQSVCLFNSSDGKYISSISHKGRAANEYLYCYQSVVDFKDSTIFILDEGKILSYTFDGDHIKTVRNDSIASMSQLNDDVFVAYNDPHSEHSYNYSLYDRDWNYIKGLYPFTKKEGVNPNVTSILTGRKFNDKLYTYIDNSFYEITNNDFQQSIFIDKGEYAMPAELLGSAKSSKYITWDNNGMIVGDYLFYLYSYNDKLYLDIWGISKGELLYRSTMSRLGDGEMGFPVKYNGTTVYMWPRYVQGNALYGVLSADDVEKLGVDNNDNPVVLRVEIQ